jgi:glycosyltransferase involved in cell wall biosynthesis
LSHPPIRVTQVVHDFEGGGLETLVAEMARKFDPQRVTPSVVSLSGRVGRLGEELEGVVNHMLAVRSIPTISLLLPLAVRRAIRETRPDVVHIHSGVWLKAALAARLAGVRAIVYTEHGREHDDPRIVRLLDRQAARMTDVVVTVSTRLERYLHERVGIPLAKLTTIQNGVDTNRFSPGAPSIAARTALGIPSGALVVGSVGRLEPVKAYDRLVRSVAMLLEGGQIAEAPYVLLCGDGSQRAALQALAASLGLGDRVRFPGWVANPVDAYRMMDVFVLPSISEGLSVSLLEAMSTGTVPLVTPVGANTHVLAAPLDSQVVAADDLSLFAAALGATLSSSERRRMLSTAARDVVVMRFSQSRMLNAYTALYEKLTSE